MLELDYTQLSLFTMCPRKYWYIYNQCLEHFVGNAAHFGSELVHPSITAWYQGEGVNWDELWEKFKEVAPKKDDEFYTLERAKDIYEKWTTQFADDRKEYEVVMSEIGVSSPVSGGRWISKPDLVLREIATGKVGVLDIKSSKYTINANLIPFDRQFLGQVRVTNAEWMMKGHAQILTREVRVTRDLHTVTQDLLDEWEKEIEVVYKWIQACEESGVWPKNAPGACTAFFTHCEFEGLCGSGTLREGTIAQMPKVDPFAYLRKG